MRISASNVDINAMTFDQPRCHSRASGNPVRNVHTELFEGFIKNIIEWFDKLTMSGNNWIPAYAGMTSPISEMNCKVVTTTPLFSHSAV